MCWSPDDQEVWFTAQAASPYAGVALRASSLSGRTRTILALPTDWRILDVARDGRALMSGEVVARQIELWTDGREQPHDVTMFDQSLGGGLSKDGQSALIVDQGNFAGTAYATYLRRLDRPEPVRLGDGQAVDFSADEQLVLSIVYGPPSRLLLLPVGAGQTTELPNPQKLTISAAAFLPNSRRVVFLGGQGREAMRGYVQEIDSGTTTAFTEPSVYTSSYTALPVSPDGSQVSMLGPDGHAYSFPVKGGPPQPMRGVVDGERMIRWSDDGRSIYVSNLIGIPQRIALTAPAADSQAVDALANAGVRRTELSITPDGRTCCFLAAARSLS